MNAVVLELRDDKRAVALDSNGKTHDTCEITGNFNNQ